MGLKPRKPAHEPAELFKQIKTKKNVVGHSGELQRRLKSDKEQREYAFRIYVARKQPLCSLSTKDIIPSEINGIPTDIIEVGEMHSLSPDADPKLHYRPSPAGVSAIAATLSACTLGWFATDNTDSSTVIICNNHCGAGENKFTPGHYYMQPSPYDGEAKRLGTLKRFVEIKYSEFKCIYRNNAHRIYRGFKSLLGEFDPCNRVDLAIIAVDSPGDIKVELLNIGKPQGKRRGIPGEPVMKMGRTTGLTKKGIVLDTQYYGTVAYGRGNARVGPCLLIEGNKFSQGGDSSSALLAMNDKAFLGLLFAGSNTHTIGCHYDFIESDGDVTILC